MLEWDVGVVLEALEPEGGVQEAVVELPGGTVGRAVYYYEEGLKHRLAPGDQVLLNTTAVSLQLGTGGFHFIHTVLSVSEAATLARTTVNGTPGGKEGHIVKLRYTSLQRSVQSVEEPASPYHELFKQRLSLEGMPVLIGELHSMLPAVLCRIRQLGERHGNHPKVAYIMSDGGALPMAFSTHVRQLSQLKWLAGTITYGQAYGGDVEAVNKYTALLAAKHILQAHMAIVLMGPGGVGTGTPLGFSGIEAGELINAVAALQGKPILIPRISFLDGRERHQGLSHHTLTVLSTIACAEAYVPLPRLPDVQAGRLRKQIERSGIEAIHRLRWHETVSLEEWDQALAMYPASILSMGRVLREDTGCLAGIGAAADEAWQLWHAQGQS